jgi:hypothetical protein
MFSLQWLHIHLWGKSPESDDWSFIGLKNRLAPERTNRLLNLCVYRSPIQLRIGLRPNTLDQLKIRAN